MSQILQDPQRNLTSGLAMPFHSHPALSKSEQAGIHHPAPSCSAQHLLPATLTTAWGQPALWPLRQDQGSLLVPWRALGECTGQPLLLSTGQVPHGASHSPALSLCPLDRKALGRNEASAEGSTATFCGGGTRCPTACEVRGGGRCGDNMSMVSVWPFWGISWYDQVTLCCKGQVTAAKGSNLAPAVTKGGTRPQHQTQVCLTPPR